MANVDNAVPGRPAAATPGAFRNPGATGLSGLDLQRFQQEVAAEMGINLQQAAAAYQQYRPYEGPTHSRGGAGEAGGS